MTATAVEVVQVAALYVESGGAYFGLPGVDPWDAERDARSYAGPFPVVAHPPCARWCQLAALVEATHGYKRGDDGGTFAHALAAVRKFGGVLEHPANTDAWRHFGLPKPASNIGWTVTLTGETVCYIEQGAYGHSTRKPTWLYVAGLTELPQLRWSNRRRNASDARWYVRDDERVTGKDRLRGAAASASPIAFRDELLSIARTCSPARAVTGCAEPESSPGNVSGEAHRERTTRVSSSAP